MNGGQEADLSAHGAILLFPSGVGLGAGSALDLAEGRHHAGSRDDIQLAEATAAALISTNHTPEGADGPPGPSPGPRPPPAPAPPGSSPTIGTRSTSSPPP